MKILVVILIILSAAFLVILFRKALFEAEKPTHEVVLSGETLNQVWFPNTWQWLNPDTKYRVEVANSKLLKITGTVE